MWVELLLRREWAWADQLVQAPEIICWRISWAPGNTIKDKTVTVFRKEVSNAMPLFSLPSKHRSPGLPSQFYFIRDKPLSKRERRGISARLAHNPQLFCALLQLLRTGDMTCEWGKSISQYDAALLSKGRKGQRVMW